MSDLASRDGFLSAYPNNPNQLALSWEIGHREPETKLLNPQIAEAFIAGETESEYLLIGRSVLAIAGIEVSQADEQPLAVDDHLFVPIDLSAYTPLADKMVERIGNLLADHDKGRKGKRGSPLELRWNDIRVGFGRILHIGGLEQLDGDQIQRAIDEHIIWIDDEMPGKPTNYSVTDGALRMDMASWKLDLDHATIMSSDVKMLDLPLHGRHSYGDMTDLDRPAPDTPYDQHTVRTALFAPGNLFFRALGTTDPNLVQIPSGAWGFPNHLMGTDWHKREQDRGQQIELVNQGATQLWGETQAEIAFYQPKLEERIRQSVQPIVDLEELSSEERGVLQEKGYDLLKLISRRDIYQVLTQALDAGNCALVITPNGITEVSRTEYDSRNARHIINAAVSSGAVRTVPEHLGELKPFIEKLGLVANNPRIVFADRLLANDIPEVIRRGDVQAIIVRNFGSPFISQQDHIAMVELASKGVTIVWDHEGDLRKMHRSGLWMNPDAIERYEDLELVTTMYGTAEQEIADALDKDLGEALEIISGIMPVRKQGIITGNGPATMAAANKYAERYGMMRLGIGIDVESKGQGGYMFGPEGHVGVGSEYRSQRQTGMDHIRDAMFATDGGAGTVEEIGLTTTTDKLLDNLLFPRVMAGTDNLFGPLKSQYQKISDRRTVTPSNGEAVQLRKTLAAPHVSRMLFNVSTAQGGARIFRRFWDNPQSVWAKALVPKKDLMTSLERRLVVADRIGRKVSPYIVDSVESYKGPEAA